MNGTRAFVDGEPADSAALIRFARNGYHHFTTMQVREGAVRGLRLHLARLGETTRALFDVELKPDSIRQQMRASLNGQADASLRLSIGARNYCARAMPVPAELETLILIDPPAAVRRTPMRLLGIRHPHPFAQFKHAGQFDLFHLRRHALMQGFDDALLLNQSGEIAEGPTFSLGFFNGEALIWPQAEALASTTHQLLHEAWQTAGGRSLMRRIHISETHTFDGAFACHAGGIWPLSGIDQGAMAINEMAMARLHQCWNAIDAEPI